MKVYRFDYLKEWVDKWGSSIPRTKENIAGLPFDILLPFIGPDEEGNLIYIPAKDHYGDTIEDIQDWIKQRDDYCEKLAEEYKKG